jgi:hypothetical protein
MVDAIADDEKYLDEMLGARMYQYLNALSYLVLRKVGKEYKLTTKDTGSNPVLSTISHLTG